MEGTRFSQSVAHKNSLGLKLPNLLPRLTVTQLEVIIIPSLQVHQNSDGTLHKAEAFLLKDIRSSCLLSSFRGAQVEPYKVAAVDAAALFLELVKELGGLIRNGFSLLYARLICSILQADSHNSTG